MEHGAGAARRARGDVAVRADESHRRLTDSLKDHLVAAACLHPVEDRSCASAVSATNCGPFHMAGALRVVLAAQLKGITPWKRHTGWRRVI